MRCEKDSIEKRIVKGSLGIIFITFATGGHLLRYMSRIEKELHIGEFPICYSLLFEYMITGKAPPKKIARVGENILKGLGEIDEM